MVPVPEGRPGHSYQLATGGEDRHRRRPQLRERRRRPRLREAHLRRGGISSDGKSVLLYDKYDVWALPLEGGKPVNLTKGVGATQEIQFRSCARPRRRWRTRRGRRRPRRRPAGADRSLEAGDALGVRRVDEEVRLLARCRPARRPPPLIWVDKTIGASTGEERRSHDLHRADFNEFPDYWVADKRVRVAEEGDRRQSDSSRSTRGARKKLIDYKNSKGDKLQAHADAARRLRAGQEVPDARVLLRDDVEHASQLLDPGVRRPPAHVDVREQRLPRAPAGRRVRDRPARHVGAWTA